MQRYYFLRKGEAVTLRLASPHEGFSITPNYYQADDLFHRPGIVETFFIEENDQASAVPLEKQEFKYNIKLSDSEAEVEDQFFVPCQ